MPCGFAKHLAHRPSSKLARQIEERARVLRARYGTAACGHTSTAQRTVPTYSPLFTYRLPMKYDDRVTGPLLAHDHREGTHELQAGQQRHGTAYGAGRALGTALGQPQPVCGRAAQELRRAQGCLGYRGRPPRDQHPHVRRRRTSTRGIDQRRRRRLVEGGSILVLKKKTPKTAEIKSDRG